MGRSHNQESENKMQNRVLIHQLEMDSEQSAVVMRDMLRVSGLRSAEKRSASLLVAGKSVIVGVLLATAYLLVSGSLPELPAAAIALVGLFATPTMEHFAHRASQERSAKLAQIKVAPHVAELYAGYAVGETLTKKVSNYVSLLVDKKIQIGKRTPYHVHLDTTNASGFIIRLFS